jgi:hypothetical protein
MDLDYDLVRYKNKRYAVISIDYNDYELPAVINYEDLKIVKNLKKKWKCNIYNFVSCTHTFNDETKDVFLHEIIMALKRGSTNQSLIDCPIIHINRIGLDNRRSNLIYDTCDKQIRKNIKKKKRTIKLPRYSGIKPDEIPTFIWYMKPNGSHGERFMVDIGDVKWKTTSRKGLSLRYKLEEAKLFLRNLKKERPELFREYSMNGDYNKKGKVLMNEYYDIIYQAGYDHIQRRHDINMTDKLLRKGKQSKYEYALLKNQIHLISPSSFIRFSRTD